MNNIIESFEVTKGKRSGDLLSEKRTDQQLKIGLIACGYFEYWRMYPGLREQVESDMRTIADRLSEGHHIVYPGMIETLDLADAAGQLFRKNNVEAVVITEGTYCPDYFVHQVLLHLPSDIPVICFAAQAHANIDFSSGYDQSLRNSGPMGIVQLTGGFRKMGRYEKYEVVAGDIQNDGVYEDITSLLQVFTTIRNLKKMTIGTIGHVFRGMYDFNFDKTAITGKLGPHIMDVQVDHLMNIHSNIPDDDAAVRKMTNKAKKNYTVSGLSDDEITRSAKLGVALIELIKNYKLNGLVLLGQHLIEAKANASCYLGLSEILSSDLAIAVTEGDVLGCIISKVMKDLSGHTPFYGEWEEMDHSLNAIMLLGHGFIDPREVRSDREIFVKPACENWGFEGNSVGFEATYPPGPVTMSHIIHDHNGWRLFISEATLIDSPPLNINECTLIVKVNQPVREYFESLMRFGFSHHIITAPGKLGKQLSSFARQLDIEICRL